MQQERIDIWDFAETNILWNTIERNHQWNARMRSLRNHRSTFAYNQHENPKDSKFLPGGVGITTLNNMAGRIVETGKDPTGLGRWVWHRLQGKSSYYLRVLSFYRPCDGSTQMGEESAKTIAQHKRYFNDPEIDPREKILDDIADQITEWLNIGDQIIIAGDLNNDVKRSVKQFEEVGLREIISSKHKNPPPTYNRNKQFSHPIDGIWATSGLDVIKCGYAPFEDGIPSDHRRIWIDIDYKTTLGCSYQKIRQRPIRRLKCSDPRLVTKYNESVYQKLKDTGILQRTMELHQKSLTEWTIDMEDEYNLIYQEQKQIRLDIERKLRKIHTGAHPWSPKFQKYRDTIELWSLILKRRRHIRTSLTKIRRLCKKLEIHMALKASRKQAWENLQTAFKEYHEDKKQAPAWRNTFLDDLAKAVAEKENIKVESAIKKLKHQETTRRTFSKLTPIRKKQKGNPVIKLFSSANGTRKEAVEKVEMENACITENTSRFLQSRNTPFLQEPLKSDIGMLSNTRKAEAILTGTYHNPLLSDSTQEYISELKQVVPTHHQLCYFSLESHIRGWKKSKENTASDPHNLGFSHYKSACQHSNLAQFDYSLRELPYRIGFTPNSWTSITDFQIYKRAQVLDVEEMRKITMFAADFNMNNKLMGQTIMQQAEDNHILHEEQYGSRKNRKSILVSLNQRLSFDLCRQRRQAAGIVSVDAKACYDRIVHNVAILNLRKIGIPLKPLLSMFNTLQVAHHYTMTAFGVSERTYRSMLDIPLQGIGQGNGAGPSIWAVINAPIISLLKRKGGGAIFRTAIALSILSFTGFSFVDDADIIHTSDNVNTPGEALIPKLQELVDTYTEALNNSGGALKESKCDWRLIDWEKTSHGWNIRPMDNIQGELSFHNFNTGSRNTI